MGVETGALAELGAMCPLSFLPSALTMLQKIAEGTAVVTLLPRHQNPLSSHMSHVHPCDSLRGSSRWADHGLCPVRSPGVGGSHRLLSALPPACGHPWTAASF